MNPLRTEKLTLTITGRAAALDGYIEMLLGIFALSGILEKFQMTQRIERDGKVTVTLEVIAYPPPLGHIGLDDIPKSDKS